MDTVAERFARAPFVPCAELLLLLLLHALNVRAATANAINHLGMTDDLIRDDDRARGGDVVTRVVSFTVTGNSASFDRAMATAAASAERAASVTEKSIARMNAAGKRMTAIGSKMTHTLTVPLVAAGTASVVMATKFDAAMTRIQTQAGGSARDVQSLSKQVLAMRNVQQGPVELAKSLYHLKSVGMSNVSAMKALRQASDLAAVGHANLEETTNALAGAWRTGIKGAKDFHTAAATVNAIIGAGNMTLEDFNAALGTGIMPSAKTFGLSMKDVGAALALFTDEGVPADEAATRLRMTLALIGSPSGRATKSLEALGISHGKAGKQAAAAQQLLNKAHVSYLQIGADMHKPNGLIVALTDLETHLKKSGLSAGAQAALLSKAFGGGRTSSGILSMLNNLDVLRGKQDQVNKGIAKYNEDVKAQQATPAAKFARTLASLERVSVVIGQKLLPYVVEGARDVEKLVSWFDHLTSGQRKFLGWALVVTAALGPVMSIFGRFFRLFAGIGKVVMALGRMGSAIGRFGTSTATSLRNTATGYETANAQAEAHAVVIQQVAAEDAVAVTREAEAVAASSKSMARSQQAAAVEAEKAAKVMQAAAVASGDAVDVEAAQIAEATASIRRVLAEDSAAAAADAKEFSVAMQIRADAAVRSASVASAAIIESNRLVATSTGATAAVTRTSGAVAAGGGGLVAAGSRGRAARVGGRMSMGGMMAGTGLLIGGEMLGHKGVKGQLGGVMKDAGVGAMIGSLAGPVGAGVGGAIGGIYGAIMNRSKGNLSKAWKHDLALVKAFASEAARAQNVFTAATTNSTVASGDQAAAIARVMVVADGLAKKAAKAGLTQKDLTNAITGSNQGYARTVAAWKKMGHPSTETLARFQHLRTAYLNSARALLNVGTQASLFGSKLHGLSRTIAANGKTLDQNTYFGRANARAIQSAAITAENHARAVYAQTGSVGKANAALRSNVSHLEAAAVAAGLNKQQVDALVRSTFGLKSKKTKLSVTLAGIAALKAAIQEQALLRNKNVVFGMKVTGLAEMQAAIAAVNFARSAGGLNSQPTSRRYTQAGGTRAAFGTKTIPPNTSFTVGEGAEHTWEGGVTDSQGRASIFSNKQAKAMGFKAPTAYASGTNSYGAIARLLSSLGATKAGIAGWLGNTSAESGGRTSAVGGPAHGLQQWQGGRFGELQAIAARMHTSWRSQAAQLAMIRQELTHGYRGTLNNLRHATSASAAANYVNRHYEISADSSGNRARLAQRFYRSGVSNASGGHVVVNGIAYSSSTAARNAEVRARQALSRSTVSLAVVASKAGATADQVKAATANLVAAARKTDVSARALSSISRTAGWLNTLAGRRGAVAARLGSPAAKDHPTAYDRLGTVRGLYNDLRSSTASAIQGSFDITAAPQQVYNDRPATSSFGSMYSTLRTAVANAKSFAAVLKKLAKEGLNRTLLSQLAQAGPAALPQAKALAAATPKQIAAMNGQYKALWTTSYAAGSTVAGGYYGAGVKAAQGLVNGLLSQEKRITAAMHKIDVSLQRQIKKDLRLHSPSRVMFGHGANVGEGFGLGIESKIQRINQAGSAMAAAAAPGSLNHGAGFVGGVTNNYVTVHAESADAHTTGAVVMQRLAMLARS